MAADAVSAVERVRFDRLLRSGRSFRVRRSLTSRRGADFGRRSGRMRAPGEPISSASGRRGGRGRRGRRRTARCLAGRPPPARPQPADQRHHLVGPPALPQPARADPDPGPGGTPTHRRRPEARSRSGRRRAGSAPPPRVFTVGGAAGSPEVFAGLRGCSSCLTREVDIMGLGRRLSTHGVDLGRNGSRDQPGSSGCGRRHPLAQVIAADRCGHQLREQLRRAGERGHAQPGEGGGVVVLVGGRTGVGQREQRHHLHA